MTELEKACTIALRDCMAIKKDESLLIVTDDQTLPIGLAFFEKGKYLAVEVSLILMQARAVNGEEPPENITELMQKFDAVICPTAKSLTHTAARRNACAAGARVATMPGITEEILVRTLKADYHSIARRTEKLTVILDKAELIRVISEIGTDIRLPVKGIKAISSTGLVTQKGNYGNLPSGESYLMPEEGKSEGVIIVDGSFAGIGKIAEKPIRITVEKGFATKIEGGMEAEKLKSMLQPLGKKAFNVAEFGIGTNDKAEIIGKILEDEKVMGTIHIAFGNNLSMGGTCDVGIHLDGVIKRPTVLVDGMLLMKEGKLLSEE